MANDKPTERDPDSNDPADDPAIARVVEARSKLMARFAEKMAKTPSLTDGTPQGTGLGNRHGMPAIPVGQIKTEKWPILDLGRRPGVTRNSFSLVIDGAVHKPLTLDWAALLQLPQVEDVSDFHCVTTWSRLDLRWRGVRVNQLLSMCELHDDATHIMIYGSDGYTTNVSLEEALKDDVLLVHTVDGQSLPEEHGGPLRMITPQLYAWKGSKWVCRLELMTADKPGFWEERGYSMSAHPWRNDRYRR